MGGKMEKINFSRQEQIFNPNEQKTNIIVVGCGSTGSFITLNLAKLGFNSISVIDFDKVEGHNIPNQFYRIKDIDKLKVDALKEIVKEFTDIEINTINQKIDENYNFDVDLNTLFIFCLDNIETRKTIYEKIKDFPIKLIDTRLGGEGYQIYSVDLENEEEKKVYEENLKGETADAPCGQKSVIYTILSIASETAQIVKQIDKGEQNFKTIKREMKNLKILGK